MKSVLICFGGEVRCFEYIHLCSLPVSGKELIKKERSNDYVSNTKSSIKKTIWQSSPVFGITGRLVWQSKPKFVIQDEVSASIQGFISLITDFRTNVEQDRWWSHNTTNRNGTNTIIFKRFRCTIFTISGVEKRTHVMKFDSWKGCAPNILLNSWSNHQTIRSVLLMRVHRIAETSQ